MALGVARVGLNSARCLSPDGGQKLQKRKPGFKSLSELNALSNVRYSPVADIRTNRHSGCAGTTIRCGLPPQAVRSEEQTPA